jgi:hypothetical protein
MLRLAASTLELALCLQRDTRNGAVVAGSTSQDLKSAEQFRRETSAFADCVGFTWLTNLSLPDLRAELSRLPDHTAVLYLRCSRMPHFLYPTAGAGSVRPLEPCVKCWSTPKPAPMRGSPCIVLHDDAERKYAYGPAQELPDTKVDTFTQALYDEVKKDGWFVVSMKKRLETRIFPFDPIRMRNFARLRTGNSLSINQNASNHP